jgi:hypothetical protein
LGRRLADLGGVIRVGEAVDEEGEKGVRNLNWPESPTASASNGRRRTQFLSAYCCGTDRWVLLL